MVVLTSRWPSSSWTVRMSAPLSRRCVANECLLCRMRHRRHYAASRTMPSHRGRVRPDPVNVGIRGKLWPPVLGIAGSLTLEPPEKRKQSIIGAVSTRRWGIRRSGFGQRLFLEREIGIEVHLGRFDGFVAQPESDDGSIDARVQEFHGR